MPKSGRIILCVALLCAALLAANACRVLPTPPLAQPTPTSAPTTTPTPLPPPAWQSLDYYRPAMLASAVDDLTLLQSPSYYHIEAYVDIAGQPPRVYAIQDVHYANHSGTALGSIYFRLWPNRASYDSVLTFEQVTVDGQVVELQHGAEGTAVGLVLSEPLPSGQAVDIHVEYDVTVPVGDAPGYGTLEYQDGILVLSDFFPIIAVYGDGTWSLDLVPDYGDPLYAESSLFSVELTVPSELVVVTTGSTVEKRQNADGTVTWVSVSGPTRTFMVAISERFQSSSLAVGFVRVNSYYLPEHQKAGEEALGYARDALRAYQQAFALYPFAEFDVVEAALIGGAMEYPGLIVISREHYEVGGEYLEFLIAHEVAHQWWYNVVGNDQINVPWLDESLTNFSTYYYYLNAYGQDRAELALQNYVARSYEQLKRAGKDGVVNQPVAAFEPGEYGPIVYGKGALFFHALRQELGDETMLQVLQAYYEDRMYRLATPDDLLRVAEQVSGRDLADLYEEWILTAQ
jgi:hypothetical protein